MTFLLSDLLTCIIPYLSNLISQTLQLFLQLRYAIILKPEELYDVDNAQFNYHFLIFFEKKVKIMRAIHIILSFQFFNG